MNFFFLHQLFIEVDCISFNLTYFLAMKAHGVPALIAYLKGEITLEEATTIGRADTRHYAKRQFTWFRHQLPEFSWVKPEAAGEWLNRQTSS